MSPNGDPVTAEGWVRKLGRTRKDLSPSEMHLLLELAALHNRHFRAVHAKIALLSAETHMGVRTIQRLLSDLANKRGVLAISKGALPMQDRHGRTVYGNIYRFVGFDTTPVESEQQGRGANLAHDGDGVPNEAGRGATGDSDGVPTERGDGVPTPNSSLNPVDQSLRALGYPGAKPGARARDEPDQERGPQEAAPRAAPHEDDQDDPLEAVSAAEGVIRSSTSECPICHMRFSGPYSEHNCGPLKRPPPRRVPPRRGHRLADSDFKMAEAELAEYSRRSAELRSQIPPDVAAEHAERLEQEHAKEPPSSEASA
jgi:hypothetical protein